MRTATRRAWRNGSYERQFQTRVGTITLALPRDRAGLFRPSLFAKYERTEQAFVLAMIEMYLHGVSTRKMSAGVETLCGTPISASEVSALTRTLDAGLTAWRERRLDDTPIAISSSMPMSNTCAAKGMCARRRRSGASA